MSVEAPAATVAEAMVKRPTTHGAGVTVGALRRLFEDDHVHVALLVEGARLVAAVERADLQPGVPDDLPAREAGRLHGRTVAPRAPLDAVHASMCRLGRRRLAVVDGEGRLLGLLCLKARGDGFCSDGDVERRRGDARDAAVALV